MKVVRFDKRRRPAAERRDVVTPMLALVALVSVCVLGCNRPIYARHRRARYAGGEHADTDRQSYRLIRNVRAR